MKFFWLPSSWRLTAASAALGRALSSWHPLPTISRCSAQSQFMVSHKSLRAALTQTVYQIQRTKCGNFLSISLTAQRSSHFLPAPSYPSIVSAVYSTSQWLPAPLGATKASPFPDFGSLNCQWLAEAKKIYFLPTPLATHSKTYLSKKTF